MTMLLLTHGIASAINPLPHPLVSEKAEGQRYITELSAAILQADRIVITEHSFDYDAFDGMKKKSLLPAQVVYARRELSQGQRIGFANEVRRLVARPRKWISNCLPQPHHTMTFYRAGREMSVLRICFECGESEWSANTNTPPAVIGPVLTRLVIGVGLHPQLDWRALARSYLPQLSTPVPR
jgi:hypothetical protein